MSQLVINGIAVNIVTLLVARPASGESSSVRHDFIVFINIKDSVRFGHIG